jgi:cation transport regulator ChaC
MCTVQEKEQQGALQFQTVADMTSAFMHPSGSLANFVVHEMSILHALNFPDQRLHLA